jgi:hypothetical protein
MAAALILAPLLTLSQEAQCIENRPQPAVDVTALPSIEVPVMDEP